ncbi:MAG: permease [Candidatus Aenigmarchaeota archaeon]|nr:permease [Candidatus Aenigmarchaeota archaeon]
MKKDSKCPHCAVKPKKWYKDRLLIIVAAAAIILSFSFLFYTPMFSAFADYLGLIWWALLLGFLLGGVIDHFIPNEYINYYLTSHRKRSIIYSVILGFLMSACSHGILAIAIELYRKGASTPSVIAFLLASPWANLPITILLLGFFGLNALYIIVSAIVVAVITGLIYQVLDRKGIVECRYCDTKIIKKFSIRKDVRERIEKRKKNGWNLKNDVKGVMKGSLSLTRMVLWWIIIGMIMASFARAFIPHTIFASFLGPSLLGLFVTLVLATVIEVCSEGSSPLSFEIFKQTGAFGNSFTFLMAGVSTDYTEIGLIWSNIGKKAAIMLPVITVPQIILLGFLFNVFI